MKTLWKKCFKSLVYQRCQDDERQVLRFPYSGTLKTTKFSLSCLLTNVPLDTVLCENHVWRLSSKTKLTWSFAIKLTKRQQSIIFAQAPKCCYSEGGCETPASRKDSDQPGVEPKLLLTEDMIVSKLMHNIHRFCVSWFLLTLSMEWLD